MAAAGAGTEAAPSVVTAEATPDSAKRAMVINMLLNFFILLLSPFNSSNIVSHSLQAIILMCTNVVSIVFRSKHYASYITS